MKVLEDLQMGYENLKENFDGLWVFWRKIIVPSAPVLGINNDQSLSSSGLKIRLYYKNGHYSKIQVSDHHHISSLMGTLNVDDYKRESLSKGIALWWDW